MSIERGRYVLCRYVIGVMGDMYKIEAGPSRILVDCVHVGMYLGCSR